MGVIFLAIIAALFFGLALFWVIGAVFFFGTVVTHFKELIGRPVEQPSRH